MKIHPFYGGPFSQWAMKSFQVRGVRYNCAEQYMMVKKAMLFGDGEAAKDIMSYSHPADQKKRGKTVKGFSKATWEAVAKDVVFVGNANKFSQNPDFLEYMLGTGDDILVEASPTDVIWGVGLFEDDPDVMDPTKWRGMNWLGEVLMDVRLVLRETIVHRIPVLADIG